jgi:hypothetical protein
MSFAANEGMGLVKNNDVGATPLRVDGQGVRVCGTTQFGFDVSYNPNLPLSCGPQLVSFYEKSRLSDSMCRCVGS